MKYGKIIAALAVSVCLLLAATACDNQTKQTQIKATVVSNGETHTLTAEASQPMHAAADYEELKSYMMEDGFYAFKGAAASAPNDEMEAVYGETEAPASADYSGTNVQVEGVDEADIVKTDGKNIYALYGSALQIIRADGSNTALIGQVFINEDQSEDVYPTEFFVYDDTVCVFANKYTWVEDGDFLSSSQQTCIYIFDISDPAQPVLKKTLGQDGDYVTSRMTNGVVYMITSEWIYNDITENDLWLPRTYCDTDDTTVPAEDIYICPDGRGECFTIVGAYDCATAALSDVCSFTGYADCVYMSDNAIYLAQSSEKELTSEAYTESQYTVTDYMSKSMTQIYRIRVENGTFTPDGSADVDGNLLNQFAMDEYNGMLRVATTDYASSYSIFKDEAYDFENYVWHDSETKNKVTVLNENLVPIGVLDDLAPDERIYSVRFMGETVYVVTYKNMDPVFTIDLSDPTKPTVLSELELFGVSDYLQSFGEGLLFGFGEAFDEDNASQGLQLSMFDTSNPKQVTLAAKTVVEDYYSEALYNHKAILASAEKNLIVFPGDFGRFYVFGFDGSAFTEKGTFELADANGYWSFDSARGLYIGDTLYLVNDQELYAVDLATFDTILHISLAEG